MACFDVNFSSDKAVFICFKGVDYIAEVFVNDEFVGRHEGFFAPFEFDITDAVKCGTNTLKVIVKNDNVMMGNANINGEGAIEFMNWITSEKGQSLIKEFGVEEYGQPLFIPNFK
mgnify:CR=1 FL=1